MKKRNQFDLVRGEHGASLVETALVLPFFFLLMLGAVDFARAIYLGIEIAGAAHAGAVYGSQNPTDLTGITAAAQDDAPDVPGLSVGTPTYGCECADGTHYTASCSTTPSCANNLNVVYRVNVTVTGTFAPLFSWPGIPSSTPLSSSASMRSAGS
ncbi:MAG: TadE/TadG family type IV pilus assembly protein [Terracidiphilus sp.]